MLTIPIKSFNTHYLIFYPAVKNNMMAGALFTRIIYSTSNVIFNGIYIYIHITTLNQSISLIEKDLLAAYRSSKRPLYSIDKYLAKHAPKSILKISGIWENDTNYGLAYKMI